MCLWVSHTLCLSAHVLTRLRLRTHPSSGFGLAHTDENFFNADLGNCLDYTNFPANNLHPDTPNFETLANMYGTVDGTWVQQTFETSGLDEEDGGAEGDDKKEEDDEDDQGEDEEFNQVLK